MITRLLHWQAKFVIEFLHPLMQGRSFTIRDIYSYLGFSRLLQSPLLNTSFRNDPVCLYLQQLSQLGIISQTPNQQWVKRCSIYLFNELEKGLNGDNFVLEVLLKKD